MYVGLYLNKERALFRRSVPLMVAIGQAFSGKMTKEWYEAITETEKDAEKLASRNKDRTANIDNLKAMAKKAREKRNKK